MRRPARIIPNLAVFAVAAGLLVSPEAHCQSGAAKSNRNKPVSTRAIDMKASQLLDGFIKESLSVALEYEQAGEPQKAKQVLETVLTFHPDAEGIKDKIKSIDEQLLSANEVKVEIEPGAGWGSPVAAVTKGQKIRIQSSGTYRVVLTATLGPEGLPTGDAVKGELAGNVPCGALMGIVIAKDKPGRPFAIGSNREYTPDQDGVLVLRLNTPPGSKCTGRVTATLSGHLGRP